MAETRNAKAERRALRNARLIVVLCGPSHSGKSTFARRFANGFTIINSDDVRKNLTGNPELSEHEGSVWAEFSARKRIALRAGRNVILDACHLSSKARRHALEKVDDRYRKLCIVFDCPFHVIKKRCLRERRMSLAVARDIWNRFKKPTLEDLLQENFGEVYFISTRGWLYYDTERFLRHMRFARKR